MDQQVLVQANALFTRGLIDLAVQADKDTDPETAMGRYDSGVSKLRADIIETFGNSTTAMMRFPANAERLATEQRTGVAARNFDRRRQAAADSAWQILDDLRSQYVAAADAATRRQITALASDAFDTLYRLGALSEVDAGRGVSIWAESAAAAYISALPSAERLQALQIPTGWDGEAPAAPPDTTGAITDVLSQDIRMSLARTALRDVKASQAKRRVEEIVISEADPAVRQELVRAEPDPKLRTLIEAELERRAREWDLSAEDGDEDFGLEEDIGSIGEAMARNRDIIHATEVPPDFVPETTGEVLYYLGIRSISEARPTDTQLRRATFAIFDLATDENTPAEKVEFLREKLKLLFPEDKKELYYVIHGLRPDADQFATKENLAPDSIQELCRSSVSKKPRLKGTVEFDKWKTYFVSHDDKVYKIPDGIDIFDPAKRRNIYLAVESQIYYKKFNMAGGWERAKLMWNRAANNRNKWPIRGRSLGRGILKGLQEAFDLGHK